MSIRAGLAAENFPPLGKKKKKERRRRKIKLKEEISLTLQGAA